MPSSVTRRAAAAAILSVLGLAAVPAAAEPFPDRPVTFIVPFSAGGAVDTIARVLAQRLSEQTGKVFVADNKTGASGNIGAQFVARSKPDGYTLVFTSLTTAAITNAMYTKGIGYKLGTELVPVVLAAKLPVVLISSPGSKITNYRELLAAAKTRPSGLTFGSAGPGSIEHLAGELFKREAKVDNMLHVPYKGGADALKDLMGSQIDLIFATGGGMFAAMDAGKAHAVAVAAAARAPVIPKTPTLQESGLAGFDAAVVYGFLAPPGLPADVSRYLQAEVQKALQHPDVVKKLGEQSAEVYFAPADQAAKVLQEQMAKWGKVVRDVNLKAD